MAMAWKKGRGKLGIMQPLLGEWQSESSSERGPLKCRRTLRPILAGNYLELTAIWQFGQGEKAMNYQETAIIGPGDSGGLQFWSFTNDGKRSTGQSTDATDLHPQAIGFEAQMPAGSARMAYFPHPEDGFIWVVESKTKKGWNRMITHHYQKVNES
jgi:hypothetical protein